ncbi:MAG: DUF5017 domain-containing protein [Phocaeicola vulgatus]
MSSTFQGNSGSITNKYTEWEDVTDNFSIPQEPVKGYGSMARAGSMKLDEFAGKNIYIAFVYEGAPDGVTTSVQIDNVLVMRNESETIVNKEVDEYDYKENEWVFKRAVPSGLLFETITMQKEDFQLVVDYVAAILMKVIWILRKWVRRILLWRKFCLWQLECKRIYA